MLTIRLMRFGRKHQPFFRLVVVPKRSKPTRGKYVESLGWVDPIQRTRSVNAERAKHWVAQGAQPSDTVWNLFVSEGIVQGKKRPKGIPRNDEGRPVHSRAASQNVAGEPDASPAVSQESLAEEEEKEGASPEETTSVEQPAEEAGERAEGERIEEAIDKKQET